MVNRSAEPEVGRAILVAILLWLTLAGGSSPGAGSPADGDAAGDPPELLSTTWEDSLPTGEPSPLWAGDTLRVRTVWSRAGLLVLADASALLGGAAEPIPLAEAPPGSYSLEVPLPETLSVEPGRTPIGLLAIAEPGDTVRAELEACLTDVRPELTSLTNEPARQVYRGNDILRIRTRWSGGRLPYEVKADLRALDPSLDTLVAAVSESGSFLLTQRIPAATPAGEYEVPIVCRDADCGAAVTTARVRIDPAAPVPPVLVDWEVLAPLDPGGRARPLVNGDTIRLWTRWDRTGLAVSADPYDLAPTDTTRPAVREVGLGEYEIVYTVPRDNPARDGDDLPFRLVAEGPPGQFAIDTTVRFCLSNFRPVHLTTTLVRPREVYRGGDTLHVVTTWQSRNGLPLELGADVHRLEPARTELVPAELQETRQDSIDYAIVYRIPVLRDNRGPDGRGILVPLVATEQGGCGSTRLEERIAIDLDTTAPDTTGPVLDPLPAQTTEDSLLVAGTTVPEAVRAALTRQGVFQSYVDVDSTSGRFSGYVRLLRDEENQLRAWVEDELGNRTRQSDPEIVLQVSTASVEFPQPFLRGEQIRVRDPNGLRDLRVGIHDLEGARIREWTDSGSSFDRSWTWDGTDSEGDAVRQGYFLVRATWRDRDGRSHERTVGLVLGN